MKKKTIKKVVEIIFAISIVIIPILIYGYFGHKEIEDNKRYTIGYATGKGWSGGSILDFEWFVNKQKYKGGSRFNKDYNLFIDKRYFVKFSSKDYSNGRILINMPVPDSIRKAPPLGWDSIEFKKLFGEEK